MKKRLFIGILAIVIVIGMTLLPASAGEQYPRWENFSGKKNYDSLGKYCFGEISLAFGAGWHIKLHNDEKLAKTLKEMGVSSHVFAVLTKDGVILKINRCTVFIEGENRDQIVIYSEFLQYNFDLFSYFPMELKIPSINKKITILGFCK